MIYTCGGIKGGAGKTTIATNLAVWLSKQGADVLLIDTDDQETATDFTAWRNQALNGEIGYTAVQLSADNIRPQVKELKKKYDHIVIDSGGRDTASQRAALFMTDIYLLPFKPRSFDFWTIQKVQRLINDVRDLKPDIRALTFLNQADSSGNDNREAGEALSQAEGIEFIELQLTTRKSFANAAGLGLSILEYKPKDEKAITELNALFTAITEKAS